MPTYEYACRDCGEHLEVVQSFKDEPLTTCGSCNGRLRKVFSAAGIIFKGSGYYVTDTRAKQSSAEGGKSGANGTSDAKKSAASGDSGSSSDTSTDTGASEGTAESA